MKKRFFYQIKQIKKGKQQTPTLDAMRGANIRQARNNIGATLAEFSGGICSIGQLSKGERGLISFNEDIYYALVKKGGIKPILRVSQNSLDYEQLSLSIMTKQELPIPNIEQDNPFESQFYKASKQCIERNFQKLDAILNELVYNCEYLTSDQYTYLVFLLTLYYYETGRYQYAFLVSSVIELSIWNVTETLIGYLRLSSSFNINNSSFIYLNYDNYLKRMYSRDLLVMASNIRQKYFVYDNVYSVLLRKTIVNEFPMLSLEQTNFLEISVMLKEKKYDLLKKNSTLQINHIHLDWDHQLIDLIVMDLNKNIDQIYEKYCHIAPINCNTDFFLNYLRMKYDKSSTNTLNILNLFKLNLENVQNVALLKYLLYDVVLFFNKTRHYKLSSTISSLITNQLDSILQFII